MQTVLIILAVLYLAIGAFLGLISYGVILESPQYKVVQLIFGEIPLRIKLGLWLRILIYSVILWLPIIIVTEVRKASKDNSEIYDNSEVSKK